MKSTFSQLCKRVPHTSEGVSTATCCFCQGHTLNSQRSSHSVEVQIYSDGSFRIFQPLFSNHYQWKKCSLYISNEYFKYNLWITSSNWLTDDVHVSLDVKIVLTKSRQAQRCRNSWSKKAKQGTVPKASCSHALFCRKDFSLQNLRVPHHMIATYSRLQ